jgi:hypothetical protein
MRSRTASGHWRVYILQPAAQDRLKTSHHIYTGARTPLLRRVLHHYFAFFRCLSFTPNFSHLLSSVFLPATPRFLFLPFFLALL